MSKIMYMLNYVGDGGTEKYVLSLMSTMNPNDCILVYSSPGPFIDKFHQLNIKTYEVQMKHPFDLNAALKIKKIAKKEKVDVIHTQFLRENYIALISKFLGAKVKVIWTYHVDVPMSTLLKSFNRVLTRFNHSVICVSYFMKEQLSKKGVSKQNIKVIYNGITDPYQDDQTSKGKTKQIAVIGRLSEEKGHTFLLESLAELHHSSPSLDWHCNIIGTGPLMEPLQKYVLSLHLSERISFKGFRDHMINEYMENDLIVIPSKNESLSYVAIEALALKKPVIATNTGGLPEVIKHDKTGKLVTYGNNEELAHTIKLLLEDAELTESFIEQGRTYFLNHFLLETMLHKTFELYNNTK